jgi:prophage maintenance system killer protein
VAGGSVLPIVIGGGLQGTTNQISVEDFSIFVNAYNAHTGSAGNVFTGPQTINNNVTINGRLTVTEVVAQYETASILFSTGSTKLGDQLTDKHEFTGSTNITGSLIADGFVTLNGQSLNNSFDRIHQASQSLQAHSASVDNQLARVYQTTQSLHVATASLQFHSASVDAQLLAIQQTTQSLQVATASLNAFTASQDGRNFIISEFTSSTNAHIVGISDFTSSQLAVNLGNAIYTASVDAHIVGISTYTSSVRDTLARVHQATQSLQVATASLQQFTASQDSRNFVVSQVTGSLIGITNGLMAFTAALDNTYATDAQLYQLYQATRSLELHSGSMIGVTNGLMAYTASNSTLNTGLRGEVDGIEAYTASLKGQAIVSSSTQVQNYDVFALNSNLYIATGSLIGITNGLMAFTAALDSTYATDAQLYQLYAETASMKGEIAGIESYTASLKAAAIVSSSQQISDYNTFAVTSSANTFYGTQTISGSLRVTAPIRTNIISGGLDVNGGITGSVKGNLDGVASYASLLAISSAGTTTDTTLYPTFTLSPVVGSYSGLYSHLSGSFFLNGVTRQVVINDGGLLVTGSLIANSGITGSLMATNGVVSSSAQIEELTQIAGLEAYTSSLKGAIVVDGTNVEVLGTLTAQEIHTTYVTSSVLFQSGSTKFGNSSDDKHEFTGSLDVGSTGHSYINIDAANASAFESGIYHKIGGVNKWEQYTAANDGNLNWYSQGNGIQFKIYPTQGASFTGPVTASAGLINGQLKVAASTASYAATFTNINDGSEGILVRTTDNDTTQYIAKFQSSPTAVSEAYIDRLLLTKDGTLTASGSVKVQNDLTIGNNKQYTNLLSVGSGVTTTLVTLPNMYSSVGLVLLVIMVVGDLLI